MRRVSLFIAMSLDGYIADGKGNVNWLEGHSENEENKDVYSEFAKDIDTILMGQNTYYQIVTELSPNEWIYGEFTTYVITHNKHTSSEHIRFTNENPVSLVERLKQEKGKNIWICGGANLVQQLINRDLIDYYYITLIPTLLGNGIQLFDNGENEIKLRLIGTQNYNGMVDLIYNRRDE